MARQKTIFERIMRKVKRDSGSAWNRKWLNILLAANDVADPIPKKARSLQGDDFFRTVQLEARMSDFDEAMRVESNEDAIVYPGLMAAWESAPVTVEFDDDAVSLALDNPVEVLRTPLGRIRGLFPACLLFDIRQFRLSLFKCDYDGLFVYPSYNEDRGHPLLLTLAVSAKKGLEYPLDSRIVLSGETFLEALDISESERKIARRRCLGGFDGSRFSLIWSPLEDEPEVCDTAALALALMCSDHTVIETLPGEKVRRLRVRLATEGDKTTSTDARPDGASSATTDETTPAGESPSGLKNELPPIPVHNPTGDKPTAHTDCVDSTEVENKTEREDEPSPADHGTLRKQSDIPALHARIAELEAALAESESKASSLYFHLRRAQSAAAESKAKAAALQKRAELVEHMDVPSTPFEALQLAEAAFADRLAFTDGARRSAAEFTKGDPREVWAVLRSMAVVLHPLIFGKAGGNIVYAFEAQSGFELTLREMKQIKRSEALSRLRTIDYKGRTVNIGAHVKGRGGKKGETLRVHFFTDEGKIVIAHCGEHLPTYDTSSL